MAERKIVQIAVIALDGETDTVYALTDDGLVWRIKPDGEIAEWRVLPLIPPVVEVTVGDKDD